MSDEMMNYDKSPIPPGKPGGIAGERNPDRSIGVDDRGRMTYASAAASGHVEIKLPSLPGSPNPTERMLARDFGNFVIGKVEAAQNRQPYMTSGPTQTPAETLGHYVASARGAKLLDANTQATLDKLCHKFSEANDPTAFYNEEVKPFLRGLQPKRRR